MLTVGSLFSGIGGFDLGLERAGMRVIWQSEIDPYASAVLRKHWPAVPNLGDVRGIRRGKSSTGASYGGRFVADPVIGYGFAGEPLRAGWERTWSFRPDVLCGGFPCQDISNAGKRAGIDGERSGLWSEFARLIGELRPRYAIMENVAALLGRGLERVLGDLAALGYDTEWHCIPASAVGAPHRRDRVWIIAYSNGDRESALPPDARKMGESSSDSLANANISGKRSDAKGFQEGQSEPGQGCDVADADQPRLPIGELLAGVQSGERNGDSRQDAALGSGGWWRVEPDVGRVAHGIPRRVDRLRCLGNAIVPQIAEIIGRAIMRESCI